MKKTAYSILSSLFVFVSILVNAQDTLLMTNGSRIPSKILEVSTTEVKYKKSDNPDGPTFVSSKSEVAFIKYLNGSTDTLNAIKPKVIPKPVVFESPKLYKSGSKYMFGDNRISENAMYKMLESKKEPKLAYHVKKAKTGKFVQYIGFLGIPTLVGGVGYIVYTAISDLQAYGPASSKGGDYTVGIVLGASGVVCLTTSGIFKSIYKKNTKAAVKLYNEKY